MMNYYNIDIAIDKIVQARVYSPLVRSSSKTFVGERIVRTRRTLPSKDHEE